MQTNLFKKRTMLVIPLAYLALCVNTLSGCSAPAKDTKNQGVESQEADRTNTKEDDAADDITITTDYVPAAGEYKNASDGEFTTIDVIPIDESSFQFAISKAKEKFVDDTLTYIDESIVESGVAYFEENEGTVAVYHDDNWDLTFDCSEYATIELSGSSEATALGSTFWNSEVLHTN